MRLCQIKLYVARDMGAIPGAAMNTILFMFHMFGLSAGSAAFVGNSVVLQLIRRSPADAPIYSKVIGQLSRIGQIGLGLLWLTGLIMVWSVYGGPQNLPGLFWVKFLCVLVVTAGVVLLDLTRRRVRAGDTSGASRIPALSMGTSGFVVLVVIFAVLAFYGH